MKEIRKSHNRPKKQTYLAIFIVSMLKTHQDTITYSDVFNSGHVHVGLITPLKTSATTDGLQIHFSISVNVITALWWTTKQEFIICNTAYYGSAAQRVKYVPNTSP